MTFLNMISIGGVGVMQFASRPVYAAAQGAYCARAGLRYAVAVLS